MPRRRSLPYEHHHGTAAIRGLPIVVGPAAWSGDEVAEWGYAPGSLHLQLLLLRAVGDEAPAWALLSGCGCPTPTAAREAAAQAVGRLLRHLDTLAADPVAAAELRALVTPEAMNFTL